MGYADGLPLDNTENIQVTDQDDNPVGLPAVSDPLENEADTLSDKDFIPNSYFLLKTRQVNTTLRDGDKDWVGLRNDVRYIYIYIWQVEGTHVIGDSAGWTTSILVW